MMHCAIENWLELCYDELRNTTKRCSVILCNSTHGGIAVLIEPVEVEDQLSK